MSTLVPAALHEAFQKGLEKKKAKERKDSEYTREERAVLGKYKDEYKNQTTPEKRDSLLTNHILVDIFNHWYNNGVIEANIPEDEVSVRVKKLVSWIRNNWRSIHKVTKLPAVRKKSRVDIVWREMKEKVIDEVRVIVNEKESNDEGEKREPTRDERFRYRTTAARKVYDKMSADEKIVIQGKVEKQVVDTSPLETQRRRAMKLAGQTIAKAAERNWKDMGILTLTFYAYTRPNGKIIVEIHDKMAANMGSHQRRFIDMYSDQADDIQRKLLEYTKLLQHPNELAVPSNRPDLDIQTENGFPLMPPLMENIEQKKDELEELLRRYLNAHYKIASGYERSHVPFGDLGIHPTEYVNKKYVPDNFIWKDPRNMNKAAIVEICEHIRKRQKRYGAEDAFRFHKFHNGKELARAIYGRNKEDEVAADRANKQKDARKKSSKQQRSQKQKDAGNQKGKEKEGAGANQTGVGGSEGNTGHVIPPEDSNIDPSLRDLSDQLRQSSDQPSNEQPNMDDPKIIVNEDQMRYLLTKGYPPAIPINGPNDGPPLYLFPSSAKKDLCIETQQSKENPDGATSEPRTTLTCINTQENPTDRHGEGPVPNPNQERPRPRPKPRATKKAVNTQENATEDEETVLDQGPSHQDTRSTGTGSRGQKTVTFDEPPRRSLRTKKREEQAQGGKKKVQNKKGQ